MKEKTLPSPTAEIVKEYDELVRQLKEKHEDHEELDTIWGRLNELEDLYDWFNVEFTDPATGKKGQKTVAGEVVVPALFDEFAQHYNYTFNPRLPVSACKDGKWGIVKGDGSGEVLCEFKFDYIENIFPYSLYLAKWGGEKDHFGVIDLKGDIICPNILASYSDWKVNAIIAIKADGKWGVIDGNTHLCVLPEYDDIESSPDDFIVFRKDGVEGYITDQGEFVTKQQYEEDENCDADYFLNCMAD